MNTISFSIPGGDPGCSGGVCTISLATALPNLASDITITGSGANSLIVRRTGAPNFRIFTIDSGKTVTITGLTITNGLSADGAPGTPGNPGENGGGILNNGMLTVANCRINGNQTGHGTDGNIGVAGGSGAGIFNSGTLTLIDSTISDNRAGRGGSGNGIGGSGGGAGGIRNDGTMTMIGSTVSGNRAGPGGSGGGNGGFGGGIVNSGTLTLVNSTISSNTTGGGSCCNDGSNSGGNGGGISSSGPLTVTNCTIVGNQTGSGGGNSPGGPGPGGSGGGVWVSVVAPNLANTIVANNTVASGGTGVDLKGAFNSGDYNLIKDTSGASFTGMISHNITGVDPLLDPLANNGGLTQTHALLPGSPAIDAGSNDNLPPDTFDLDGDANRVEPLPVDQRGPGFPRTINPAVDIGAFESQVVKAPPSLSINDVSLTEGDSGTKSFNFTVTLSAANNFQVTVDFATANGTATTTGSDYQANSGTLTFNSGDTTKTITVLVNGDQLFEPNETFFVNLSNPTNATISDNQGVGTIINDDAQGGIISFSSPTYNTNENSGVATITVQRLGTLTQAVTVDYATSDDSEPPQLVPCAPTPGNTIATSRCDFITATGRLNWAAGDGAAKTFTVLINQDTFMEGPESLSLTLSNLTGGAAFATPSTATLTIVDDDLVPPTSNLIDDPANFVKQHYRDFLNREADAAGLAFWTNQIASCGADAQCIEVKRVNVSAAFFLSIEFQVTGGTAYLTNKAAFGAGLPSYLRFETDAQNLGKNYVFGQAGAEAILEANKVAYFNEYVTRPAFTNIYNGMTDASYVDTLIGNTGVAFTSTERDALANGLAGQTETRATVLRKIAEKQSFRDNEFNRMFVLMEYLGYLRRNPDTPGFNFWLNKLNQFNGNFVQAEMVKAFISSGEYRNRFGP